MKSIVVLSVVTLSIGLASGGLLFKKGAAIGAIKGLFKKKGEDDNRECQVRWEEVSKPVCTTSYERVRSKIIFVIINYLIMSMFRSVGMNLSSSAARSTGRSAGLSSRRGARPAWRDAARPSTRDSVALTTRRSAGPSTRTSAPTRSSALRPAPCPTLTLHPLPPTRARARASPSSSVPPMKMRMNMSLMRKL